jgi:hypothetical protein
VAGALEEREYEAKLVAAGFEAIGIEPTRIYLANDARAFLEDAGPDVAAMAERLEGRFMSAFVRATKPGGAAANACCGPTCCS